MRIEFGATLRTSDGKIGTLLQEKAHETLHFYDRSRGGKTPVGLVELMADNEVGRCPDCGEPLLAYEADAGRYIGCPECLWVDQRHFPVASPAITDSFLISLPSDPLPAWMISDIDEPPTG